MGPAVLSLRVGGRCGVRPTRVLFSIPAFWVTLSCRRFGTTTDVCCDQVTVQREIGAKKFEIELHDTMGVADLPSFDEGIVQMDGWILVFSVESKARSVLFV